MKIFGIFEAFCFNDAIEKLLANLITSRTISAWQNNDSTNSGFAFFRSSFKDVFRDAFLLRPIDLTRNLRDENKEVFGRFFSDAFKVLFDKKKMQILSLTPVISFGAILR